MHTYHKTTIQEANRHAIQTTRSKHTTKIINTCHKAVIDCVFDSAFSSQVRLQSGANESVVPRYGLRGELEAY